MGRQRNRPQVKGQENFPEELDEMETSNLSDREVNDYKDTEQHEKKYTKAIKKGPVRNKECSI